MERKRGFVLALADGGAAAPGPLGCAEVQGFDDARLAAGDPGALAPLRLCLVAPDEETIAWLERWAEDAEQVRRRIAVRRVEDGATVTVIATIASFGAGVAPSLAVESIRSHWGGICRSGVHSRAEVEAALARYDAGGRGSDPPAWPCDQ